jgi:hypothetical protein
VEPQENAWFFLASARRAWENVPLPQRRERDVMLMDCHAADGEKPFKTGILPAIRTMALGFRLPRFLGIF